MAALAVADSEAEEASVAEVLEEVLAAEAAPLGVGSYFLRIKTVIGTPSKSN